MKTNKSLLIASIVGLFTTAAFCANTLSAGGHSGIIRSQSAEPLGVRTFQLGGMFHYGQEMGYIHSITPSQDRTESPRLISGAGYIGFGVAPILDVGLNLPAYYDYSGYGDRSQKGIGDLEFSLKLSSFYLKGDDKVFTAAYYLAFQFPTGDEQEGFFPRHAYYGSESRWSAGNLLLLPMLVSTIHFDRINNGIPMRMHLNFGGVFNTKEYNDCLNSSIGLEFFPNEILTFFAEISAEERIKTVNNDNDKFFSDLINDPIYVTPGLKISFPKAFMTMTLAADFGISESSKEFGKISYAEDGTKILHQANPLYNLFFGLNVLIPGVPKDLDNDGIINKDDKCPEQAEDIDGFKDEDGCPDNDNDEDGIPDDQDKCPNNAGIAENGGCPDVDTDNDGIVDRLDKCPEKPGIKELDGCPDVDTDGDGIVDRLDKCPNESEDFDGFEDTDGCPDKDNDGDGFPDLTDNCPNNPGVAENGGCPKTKEISRGQLILKGVNFETGKATLLLGSYNVLNEIAESLIEWTEVKVEVQGHSDNSGNAQNNLVLSQQRAETVRLYLINKGVSSDRLTAVGYGQERPIADNKTATGRSQNRRVELNRID